MYLTLFLYYKGLTVLTNHSNGFLVVKCINYVNEFVTVQTYKYKKIVKILILKIGFIIIVSNAIYYTY